MQEIIKVQHLKKYYKNIRAVDDISFSVKKGELFGFLGVNGAGKSTTIHMLCTLYRPMSGRVEICGMEMGKQDEEIRKRIGVVWQNNCLDEMLTVRENLMTRASLYGYSGKKIQEQTERVARELQLEEIMNQLYYRLSGGQKRRAEIGAALLNQPEILFLDEPTTGLDPATRKLVWESIEALRKQGMTVFLTTHYMEEAARADRIAIMDAGKIVEQGTPFELKERHAKDKLILYYKDNQVSTMEMESSLDAIAVLEQQKAVIKGFEMIQGTMDDVFLNITGRGLD